MLEDVLQLDDPRAVDRAMCGGKAANLARLHQRAIPVPTGIVLPVNTIDRILGGWLDGGGSEDGSEPPASINADFARALDPFLAGYSAQSLFAVRSSAVAEDSMEASFAGQFETKLNCRKHEIVPAVLACIRSSRSERVRAYASLRDLAEPLGIAVLVQEMVEPDIAGVMFSVNPLNGSADEILVNFSEGYGSAVADGEGTVSQLVLSRRRQSVVGNDGPHTQDGMVDRSQSVRQEHGDALLAAAAQIEAAFGYPQDIEWAIRDCTLWILQARTITAVSPCWTRDETAERFPNRITPLSWSVVKDVFQTSLRKSLELMALPPFRGEWFSEFEHAIYGNQSAMEFYRYVLKMRVGGQGGSANSVADIMQRLSWTEGPLRAWRDNIDNFLIELGKISVEIDRASGPTQIWTNVERLRDLAFEYFSPNIAISMGHGALFSALSLVVDLANRSHDRALSIQELTAGCETKTRTMEADLLGLARLIRSNMGRRGLEIEKIEAMDIAALKAESTVGRAIGQFMHVHGHREIDNFLDPYYASLEERPDILVALLKPYLRADPKMVLGNFIGQEREVYRKALAELIARFPEQARSDVMALVELTRRYIEVDDIEHYQTARLQRCFRSAVRALGNMFVALGVVRDWKDLFFATYAEIRDLKIGGNAGSFAQTLQERKASYSRALSSPISWFPDADLQLDDEDASVLKGVRCSAGAAEGPVFKVASASDMSGFPAGAVLVATAALPTWTPLFRLAAAVVTEGGGPLSHAAIVARECGIPAVMGVKHCVRILKNGDVVRVDGNKGFVEVVATSDDESDRIPMAQAN